MSFFCRNLGSIGSLLLLIAAGCQTAGEVRSQGDMEAVNAAAKQAQECRATAARKPAYGSLGEHMPLANIEAADLHQMTDATLISPAETVALSAWSHDPQQCRNAVVAMAERSGLSSYLPSVLADRDRQDRILVLLIQRKIHWGEAVLRLKASRTDLLAGLAEESEQRAAAYERSSEAARADRVALLNAVFRLAP